MPNAATSIIDIEIAIAIIFRILLAAAAAALDRLGIGDLDDTRLQGAIDLIVAAKHHPRRPLAGEVFTRRFLPPLDSRVRSLARAAADW